MAVVFFSRFSSTQTNAFAKIGKGIKMNNYENLESSNIFKFYPPENKFIGILSIPHSGEIIPQEFIPFLTTDNKAKMQDVDYKVNELVDIMELQRKGIAVVVSNIHRVCVDLNRSEQNCVLNWKKNSMGVDLVTKEPSEEQVEQLRLRYHTPYFTIIKSLLEELHRTQNPVSFIDLHSMPSTPTEYHLKINPNQAMQRPDFCVSDISGKSCSPKFISKVCEELKKFSANVTQNDPYFGGYITQHVNEHFNYTNNVQIEIKRGIYMDEAQQTLIPELSQELKVNLTKTLVDVFKYFDVQN